MFRGLPLIGAVFAAITALAAAGETRALTRVALVIGNSNYANEPHLVNPANDAKSVADALRQAGFQTVTFIPDANVATLTKALHTFEDQALKADVAVLYYAGHGMEMNGVNYLIPVDARLRTDRDLSYEAVTQSLAESAAGGARSLSIVILDACRDNPFAASMQITSGAHRSMSRGLAPVDEEQLSANALVEYSAGSGATASDGDASAGHSPFAAALVRHLAEPGVEISLLFGKVRDDVWKDTQKSQRPASYGTRGGDPVYIVPPKGQVVASASTREGGPTVASVGPARSLAPTPPPPSDEKMIEAAFWQSVGNSNDPIQLQAYIARYPDGEFTGLAKRKISDLASAAQPKTGGSDALEAWKKGYAAAQAKDYAAAAKWDLVAAKGGNAFAQYNLALLYYNGLGAPKDYSQASPWFQKAAASSYPPAENMIGTMLQFGHGIDLNYKMAVQAYQVAAAQDYAPAQYHLGYMLENGLGQPVDHMAAMAMFRKSAAQGYASAQGEIGYLYAMGYGVTKDHAEALRWYRLAAASGDATAMSNLGLCYQNGRGVPQDFAAAIAWYTVAAKKGNATAQHNLALLYLQGRGDAPDPAKGRYWMARAAQRGNVAAKAWMDSHPVMAAASDTPAPTAPD